MGDRWRTTFFFLPDLEVVGKMLSWPTFSVCLKWVLAILLLLVFLKVDSGPNPFGIFTLATCVGHIRGFLDPLHHLAAPSSPLGDIFKSSRKKRFILLYGPLVTCCSTKVHGGATPGGPFRQNFTLKYTPRRLIPLTYTDKAHTHMF